MPSVMFACLVISEELKRTHVYTYLRTKLCFTAGVSNSFSAVSHIYVSGFYTSQTLFHSKANSAAKELYMININKRGHTKL